MIRRLALPVVSLAIACAALPAQLPLITVPHGALRLDLSGSFYPNDEIWDNGTRQPLGATFSGSANPMIAGLQSGLGQALAQPVTGLSLGALSAVAAREHGVGDIGLAYGLTRRISIFATVPIVYVRSRVTVDVGTTPGGVGLNPADPQFGTTAGKAQTSTFFGEFDAALSSLTARVQQGDYAGDPNALALAQETLTRGSAMRAALYTLLADSVHASPVLPTSTDPYGMQLLTQVTALQTTLSGPLGVSTPFTVAPALPAAALSSTDLATLLSSPAGFGMSSPNNLPRYGLGDVEAGVAVQLEQRGTVGGASWRSLWLRFTGRFPTGTRPDPSIFLSQGTGDGHPALQLDGIVEFGRHAIGLRGEASYQHQLAANSLELIAAPDQALVPASYAGMMRSQPGDSFSVAARPFIRFAPHLAATAMLEYWWKGTSHTDYAPGETPIPGADPAQLDVGSGANAAVVGIGLSYSYEGAGRDGSVGPPVEAGWSLERTIVSGHGIFPASLTSRVSLRIYWSLVKH